MARCQAGLVLWDACRSLTCPMPKRSIEVSEADRSNLLLLYACSLGSTASDGPRTAGSPFASSIRDCLFRGESGAALPVDSESVDMINQQVARRSLKKQSIIAEGTAWHKFGFRLEDKIPLTSAKAKLTTPGRATGRGQQQLWPGRLAKGLKMFLLWPLAPAVVHLFDHGNGDSSTVRDQAPPGVDQDRLQDADLPENISIGIQCEVYCTSDQSEIARLRRELDSVLAGHNWRVYIDRSVQPSSDWTAAVVKSAILFGTQDCDQLYTAWKALEKHSITVKESCGLLVQIGCLRRRWTLEECKRLLRNFVRLEPAFNMLMPPSTRQNITWCKSIRDTLGGLDAALERIDACTNLEILCETVNAGLDRQGRPDRYYNLNLRTLFLRRTCPGTIEFRQLPGSQNPAKVMGFVVLKVKLVEFSCFRNRMVSSDLGPFDALMDFFYDVEVLQHFLPQCKAEVHKCLQQLPLGQWYRRGQQQ